MRLNIFITITSIHRNTCSYFPHSGIIILFLIRSLGFAKGHLGAFWHLWGVNSSPGEAVWLSCNPRPPPPTNTQHSPNHSDSQMVASPAASYHNFQLSQRPGKAIAQLSRRSDVAKSGARKGQQIGNSCIQNLGGKKNPKKNLKSTNNLERW